MNKDFCNYHPKQALVGVCPFCLTEKLLIVEANQAHRSRLRRRRSRHEDGGYKCRNVVLQKKMFGLGSLFNRLELRRRRRRSSGCDGSNDRTQSTSTSLEDSFISIKFEDNGVALWDNSKVSKAVDDNSSKPWGNGSWRSGSNKSVTEHGKSSRVSLRWRKWISHLLQLVKLKRCNEGNGGEVMKVKSKGWVRTLTRRRAKKE